MDGSAPAHATPGVAPAAHPPALAPTGPAGPPAPAPSAAAAAEEEEGFLARARAQNQRTLELHTRYLLSKYVVERTAANTADVYSKSVFAPNEGVVKFSRNPPLQTFLRTPTLPPDLLEYLEGDL